MSNTIPYLIEYAGLSQFWPLLLITTALIQLAFGVAVSFDARIVNDLRGTFLLPPSFWMLSVLVLGLPAVALYWVSNRSTLRRDSV